MTVLRWAVAGGLAAVLYCWADRRGRGALLGVLCGLVVLAAVVFGAPF